MNINILNKKNKAFSTAVKSASMIVSRNHSKIQDTIVHRASSIHSVKQSIDRNIDVFIRLKDR